MGVSVDLNYINKQRFLSELDYITDKEYDKNIVLQILAMCGMDSGENFVILNNEYIEDENAYYCMFRALDAYLGLKEKYDGGKGTSHNVFLKDSGYISGWIGMEKLEKLIGMSIAYEEEAGV